MNLQSRLYYELLSNFMGKGDKESFAFALLAAGQGYRLAGTPVGSVGLDKCTPALIPNPCGSNIIPESLAALA